MSEGETRRLKMDHYRREVCNMKQMTKIFVFLDKDWEDRGTGPVYFILKHQGKFHKLNDYDLDRLHFNFEQHRRREQQRESEEKEKQQSQAPVGQVLEANHVKGKNLAILSSNLGDNTERAVQRSVEGSEPGQTEAHMHLMNEQEYSLKIHSEPESKLYEAYLDGSRKEEIVEESGLVYAEPSLDKEVALLNNLGLSIRFETDQVKPRTGELYILILRSDDNNLPKRPDSDLNEILKGEFQDNEDVLMWYNLSQIYLMDPPYNNIIEWQHENKDKLKLAISFLSFPRCEESYHAIIRNVGIESEEILSPIEPGCNLEMKLINMKLDNVEIETIKTAYMNPSSRYIRGMHREFCMSLYYGRTARLEALGEIFKYFVFLSDMDIMTNLISDENHLMFFTCLNHLPENRHKHLDFEQFFREKAAMINVLKIKKEEIIVVINNRFRLIFLKDFVFSVSLSEEVLQHYNIFLIMNGTTVINYLIESMETLFSNLDELIQRNVDQMTNFFGEFFGTIKHHFIQFEELKIKFSSQMVELGMWKTLSALILRNLHQVEKLSNHLHAALARDSARSQFPLKALRHPASGDLDPKSGPDRALPGSEQRISSSIQPEGLPANLGSSFVSVVSEVKSVRAEDQMEAHISRSVVGDRRRPRGVRPKARNREYLEKSLQKVRKKVLLCLEVLSFIIKHNKQSANQIFFEQVYKGKCLADGIFELSSFPFLSVRETFAEIFNFFVHYMDNKENFVHFLFQRLFPSLQKTLHAHRHKFDYFEEDGFMRFLDGLREKELQKNQISAIKKDQLQSKEPYQQVSLPKLRKHGETLATEVYRERLKSLKYRQFSEGPSFWPMGRPLTVRERERELAESARSQEDLGPKSLRVEESLMSEFRSDLESLRKRSAMDCKHGDRNDKKADGIREFLKFQREKKSFEHFLAFYLGMHDVMDKIGMNEAKYWERKEELFRDCGRGFFIIEKKHILVYFLKVLHEAVNKDSLHISETLFTEELLEKLLRLASQHHAKNSMISCILKGIFHGLSKLPFKDIQKALARVYDRVTAQSPAKKLRLWRHILQTIMMSKKEQEFLESRSKEVLTQEYAGVTGHVEKDPGEGLRGVLDGTDAFAKKKGNMIGRKAIRVSDSLINSGYFDNPNSSDEDVPEKTSANPFQNLSILEQKNKLNQEPDQGSLKESITKQLFQKKNEEAKAADAKDDKLEWKDESDELQLPDIGRIRSMVKFKEEKEQKQSSSTGKIVKLQLD